MKKIFVLAVFALAAVQLNAQSMADAINYSENHYYGSARTMAMGNAFTAVGGDLGSVGINPAGSAVAGYSQFTITPGLSISSVGAAYAPSLADNYGNPVSINKARFTIPNLGASLRYETGNRKGVKSVTFAFVSNTTKRFQSRSMAVGLNSQTSKFAELASAADGYGYDILSGYDSYYDNSLFGGNIYKYWDVLTAARAGAISDYGTLNHWVGASETLHEDAADESKNYHYVPGALKQTSILQSMGSKNDFVLNMGMNVSDKLYLGFNLGIPSASYSYSEYYQEMSREQSEFPIEFSNGSKAYFDKAQYNYIYNASVDGVYAKLGAIWLPTSSLRLGAAIQSPTSYTITQNAYYQVGVNYTNASYSAESPTDEYSYRLRSPYIVNLGAAYTFGTLGMVSVDYELTDYSVMKFSEAGSEYSAEDPYYDMNRVNKLFCGASSMLRIGAEFNISPMFSARAGYTFASCPERYYVDGSTKVYADDYYDHFDDYEFGALTLGKAKYYKDNTQSYSLGFGYSSNGSFFADFAIRLSKYPSSSYSPYYSYDNVDKDNVSINASAPSVHLSRKIVDAALTFGWRF